MTLGDFAQMLPTATSPLIQAVKKLEGKVADLERRQKVKTLVRRLPDGRRAVEITSKDATENLLVVMQRLVERVAALEQRTWVGVFDPTKEYKRHQMVTFKGSIWNANIDSKGVTPGGDGTVWTMCLRKPRDGRDAR